MFDSIRMKLSILFATAILNIKTIWASSASIPMKLFYTVRQGFVIIAAVVALGVLTIVIPIVYLISVSVGNQLPAGGLSAGQSSTLQTLVNNGGSALVLRTRPEKTESESHNRGDSSRCGHYLAGRLESNDSRKPVHDKRLVVAHEFQEPLGSSAGTSSISLSSFGGLG